MPRHLLQKPYSNVVCAPAVNQANSSKIGQNGAPGCCRKAPHIANTAGFLAATITAPARRWRAATGLQVKAVKTTPLTPEKIRGHARSEQCYD